MADLFLWGAMLGLIIGLIGLHGRHRAFMGKMTQAERRMIEQETRHEMRIW